MPIFDYRCDCGHIWEEMILSDNKDPIKCPACNMIGQNTRLVGLSHFKLKGDGWYETDFKHHKIQKDEE
jgi:putative FmdB family regulatory protein